MTIGLGLGGNGHLARKVNWKGASIGQFAIRKAMWRIIREINEEVHLQYVIVSMGAASANVGCLTAFVSLEFRSNLVG